MKKRLLSMALCLLLLLSLLPGTVLAVGTAQSVTVANKGTQPTATFTLDGATPGAAIDISYSVVTKAVDEGELADAGGYVGTSTITDNGIPNVVNTTGVIPDGDTTLEVAITGLAASTEYKIYFYATDAASDVVNYEFATDATGKVVEPFTNGTTTGTATATVGVAFTGSAANAVSGGTGSYKFELDAGETLPDGLTLNATTGAITGTPENVAKDSGTTKIKITENGGSGEGEYTITWTVNKGTQKISVKGDQSVKEGATVDVDVTGAKGTVKATSSDSSKATVAVIGNKITVTGVAEGTVTITVSADGTNDYEKAADITFKVTVRPATAPDIKVTNNEHTYDGTAKTAKVEVIVEGKTVTPDSITYGGAVNQTNANEAGYEIVVTVGGKTYTPAEKLVINKAPVTITFSEAAAGKTLADVKKDLTGVVEADKADVTLNGFTWNDGDTTTIAAGQEYAWTATLTGTKAANYELEITPLKINAVGSGIVIGGSKQTYTVTYNVGSHGNFSSDASTTEKVAKNETPKNVPVVHPHDNYRFMGWTLDGKTVVDPTTQKITKNVTFTALYEACDHMAYMVGRSDTQFAPNGNLTRAEAATILSRLTAGFDENGTYAAAPYSDLNTAAWYAKYVNFAASKGIVNGRPDGTFDPDASITRAEFATMIANFAGVGRVEAPSASNDVAGHWAAGYIVALERANIVTGYEDGTFRPNANITRAEAATMVNGAIDRTPDTALDLAANSYTNPFTDVTAGQWFFAQVMEATVNHVTAHFHTDK